MVQQCQVWKCSGKVIVDVSLKTVSGERNPSWNRKSKKPLSVVVSVGAVDKYFCLYKFTYAICNSSSRGCGGKCKGLQVVAACNQHVCFYNKMSLLVSEYYNFWEAGSLHLKLIFLHRCGTWSLLFIYYILKHYLNHISSQGDIIF